MTTAQLSALLAADRTIRLLDVRTPSEFENGHINGAYNVPLDQLHEHANEIRAASGTVVLICQSGRRAQRAELLLQRAGMANVHVLDGGMNAWTDRRFAVHRIRRRVSLERQVRMVAGAIVATGAVAALTLSPLFAVVPLLIGTGLVFAGATDTCAMGMLLAKLPYNRGSQTCDTETIVQQFLES
jgi:rhodanese-related sulfurtransferase